MARWALLVIGDTQYLFDGDRTRPDLLRATFTQARRLAAMRDAGPVLHVIHVGDVTEHGSVGECASACEEMAFGCRHLDAGVTVVAGNHDVDQTTTDQRGATPFLDYFGARGRLHAHVDRAGRVIEADPTGYSTWQLIDVPGPGGSDRPLTVAVLGLDWRPGPQTWRWAEEVLAAHRTVPTVVVTHDVGRHRRSRTGAACGPGELTAHGTVIMDSLAAFDQVFLVLAGHEWPSTALHVGGRDVHVVNYQDLPLGGGGGARLYCFDTDRGECDVVSFSPGLHDPLAMRSVAVRRALSMSREEDQLRMGLPQCLGGSQTPWQAAGLRLVADLDRQELATVHDAELALPGRYVVAVDMRLPECLPDQWQVPLCRLAGGAGAPDGSPEPLAALSVSTEGFVGWQAYTTVGAGHTGETWQTSHELAPGQRVNVVVAGGGDVAGLWIDGDRVGRDDGHAHSALVDGPWYWRFGAGEYGGENADAFTGVLTRVRVWSADGADVTGPVD